MVVDWAVATAVAGNGAGRESREGGGHLRDGSVGQFSKIYGMTWKRQDGQARSETIK